MPAQAGEPPPLAAPEPLVPSDVLCYVRGPCLERLRGLLEDVCARLPAPLAYCLRTEAFSLLADPLAAAADGSRPWGAVIGDLAPVGRGQAWALLLPVDDPALFLQAAQESLPGAQVRLCRGYAILTRDAALAERLTVEPTRPVPAFPEGAALSVRFHMAELRAHAAERLGSGWVERLSSGLPAAPALQVARRAADQMEALTLSFSCEEGGMRVLARMEPLPGTPLAALAAAPPPPHVRWMGLAPPGAALAAELHMDAGLLRGLLSGFPCASLLGGDVFLAAARGAGGWEAHAAVRLSDRTAVSERLADGGAFALEAAGGSLEVRLEAPAAPDASVRMWTAAVACGGVSAVFEGAAALSGDVLVASAGEDAAERVVATVMPLAEGLEPRLDLAFSELLKGMPDGAHALLMLSLKDHRGLLAPLGEADAFLAVVASARGGNLEIDVRVPAAAIPAFEEALRWVGRRIPGILDRPTKGGSP